MCRGSHRYHSAPLMHFWKNRQPGGPFALGRISNWPEPVSRHEKPLQPAEVTRADMVKPRKAQAEHFAPASPPSGDMVGGNLARPKGFELRPPNSGSGTLPAP